MSKTRKSRRWQFVVFPAIGVLLGVLSCPLMYGVSRWIAPPSMPGGPLSKFNVATATTQDLVIGSVLATVTVLVPVAVTIGLLVAGLGIAQRNNRQSIETFTPEQMSSLIEQMAEDE